MNNTPRPIVLFAPFVVIAIFFLKRRRLKYSAGWGKQKNNPKHKECSHGE